MVTSFFTITRNGEKWFAITRNGEFPILLGLTYIRQLDFFPIFCKKVWSCQVYHIWYSWTSPNCFRPKDKNKLVNSITTITKINEHTRTLSHRLCTSVHYSYAKFSDNMILLLFSFHCLQSMLCASIVNEDSFIVSNNPFKYS